MEEEIEQSNDLLLNFFDKNKEACIQLYYPNNKNCIPCDISLEKLCEIIKLKIEREANSVRMD